MLVAGKIIVTSSDESFQTHTPPNGKWSNYRKYTPAKSLLFIFSNKFSISSNIRHLTILSSIANKKINYWEESELKTNMAMVEAIPLDVKEETPQGEDNLDKQLMKVQGKGERFWN